MAKPIDEEAHFRIDEIERTIAAAKSSIPSTEVVAGIAMGVGAAAVSKAESQITALEKKIDGIAESNRLMHQAVQMMCAAMQSMCESLCKPTTREISAQLPSGRVTMTVNETRN
jgi:hypothetical protein